MNYLAEALASKVSRDNFDNGLIYPPLKNIRKISAHIAAKVAAKAYDLGEPYYWGVCTFFIVLNVLQTS